MIEALIEQIWVLDVRHVQVKEERKKSDWEDSGSYFTSNSRPLATHRAGIQGAGMEGNPPLT